MADAERNGDFRATSCSSTSTAVGRTPLRSSAVLELGVEELQYLSILLLEAQARGDPRLGELTAQRGRRGPGLASYLIRAQSLDHSPSISPAALTPDQTSNLLDKRNLASRERSSTPFEDDPAQSAVFLNKSVEMLRAALEGAVHFEGEGQLGGCEMRAHAENQDAAKESPVSRTDEEGQEEEEGDERDQLEEEDEPEEDERESGTEGGVDAGEMGHHGGQDGHMEEEFAPEDALEEEEEPAPKRRGRKRKRASPPDDQAEELDELEEPEGQPRPKKKCPRGSSSASKRKRPDAPVTAQEFVRQLARISRPGTFEEVEKIFAQASSAFSPSSPSSTPLDEVAVFDAYEDCRVASAAGIQLTWQRLMKAIRLNAAITKAKNGEEMSVREAYDRFIVPHAGPQSSHHIEYTSFDYMNTQGARAAMIASRATLHTLLLVVGLKMTTTFRSLSTEAVNELTVALKNPYVLPDSSPAMIEMKRHIIEDFNPQLAKLHAQIPLFAFGKLFGQNLEEDDSFWRRHWWLSSLKAGPRDPRQQEARDSIAPRTAPDPSINPFNWHANLSTSSTSPCHSMATLGSSASTPPDHPSFSLNLGGPGYSRSRPIEERGSPCEIQINFDLEHRDHKNFPIPPGPDEEKEERCRQWTERERKRAETAKPFKDLEGAIKEFKTAFITSGKRRQNSRYVALAALPQQDLVIKDKFGNLVLYLTSRDAVSDKDCFQLWPELVPLLGVLDIPMDSSNTDVFQYVFTALHMCVWNKYCADAPDDISPEEEERPRLIPVHNARQLVPHQAAGITEDTDRYDQAVNLLLPFFSIIVDTLRVRMPDVFAELEKTVREVPSHEFLPGRPYTGFVINMMACCLAHRDSDEGLCCVMTFGGYTGGALCLYEAGIRLDLKCGDIVFFPSHLLTHFNLHFKGRRGSLVLQSGKDWSRFAEHRNNGWGSSKLSE